MSWLEALLVAAAGLVGGFVSTLASKGSAVTLLALEFLSLPEHVANGTNRLSVIALGLVGAASFYRRGLLDWRKGFWISALVGSLAAVEFGETTLDAIVTVGLAVVLGLLLVKPGCGAAKGRSGRSVRGRPPSTSPSVSTRASLSSAPVSSCSPRSSC